MDSTLTLVTTISLLYKESHCIDRDNSADLAKKVIQTLKINDTLIEGDPQTEILKGLRATAIWMIGNPKGFQYEKSSFLQRIRLNTLKDQSLYDSLASCIDVSFDDMTQIIRSINHAHHRKSAFDANEQTNQMKCGHPLRPLTRFCAR